jgi:excisionase family DNA binding protein
VTSNPGGASGRITLKQAASLPWQRFAATVTEQQISHGENRHSVTCIGDTSAYGGMNGIYADEVTMDSNGSIPDDTELLRIADKNQTKLRHVSPKMIYKLIDQGRLPHVRIGRRVYLTRRGIEQFILAGGSK